MSNADYSIKKVANNFNPIASLKSAVNEHAESLPIVALREVDGVNFSSGTVLMVNDEVMLLTNKGASSWSVKRGCADTVPTAHSQSSSIFVLTSIASDFTERLGTSSVAVKLLPKTPSATMPMAYSPPTTVTFAQRFKRPYPPAQMRANSGLWTSKPTITSDTALSLSWVGRNRVTQADVMLGQNDAAVAPEDGTTYTVRLYTDGGTLVKTYDAITGSSWSYSRAQAKTDFGLAALANTGNYSAYLTLCSTRDGLDSWTHYRIPFLVDTTGI